MSITRKNIEHIAQLARIELTESEIDKFTKDLSAVLDWMGKLNELDTENVEPIAHIGGIKSKFRADKIEEFGKEGAEKIREAFPQKSGGFNKVKKIL